MLPSVFGLRFEACRCPDRSPWRSTKAFCAPMATMSVTPIAVPVAAAVNALLIVSQPAA